MKPVLLCLLLLPACSFGPDNDPIIDKYVLTWYCVSAEGCQRTEEAAGIDRATITDFAFLALTSTQDPSFDEQGELLHLDSLPTACAWAYYLSFFGHDLERSMLCLSPAGFEHCFREVADLVEAGSPAFDQIAALAASYGLEFGDAPWLPDIIARYGLSHYGGS